MSLLIGVLNFKFAFAFVRTSFLHDQAIFSDYETITLIDKESILFSAVTEGFKALITLILCFITLSIFIIRIIVCDLLLTGNLDSCLRFDFAAFN